MRRGLSTTEGAYLVQLSSFREWVYDQIVEKRKRFLHGRPSTNQIITLGAEDEVAILLSFQKFETMSAIVRQ